MRSTKLFTVSVAASLFLAAVAHASDAPGLPWGAGSMQRVSEVGARHYPGLHWTSGIGMGTAASPGRGGGAQHYPDPDWTATIGTGTAASLER